MDLLYMLKQYCLSFGSGAYFQDIRMSLHTESYYINSGFTHRKFLHQFNVYTKKVPTLIQKQM